MSVTHSSSSKSTTVSESAAPALAFLGAVAVFPIVLAALLSLTIHHVAPFSTVNATTDYASIRHPAHGNSIARNFNAHGTIDRKFPGHYLYIVEIGDGLTYPKYAISHAAESWSADLYTGAPSNSIIRLQVVAVDDADNNLFTQWFKTGESTGQYPGLPQVSSLQPLAEVTVHISDD